jgi:pSer/pThr/pTyr-binding forkhead associated (FHA) protein
LSGQHKGKAIYIDTREFVVGRERSVSDLVIDHNESGQQEVSISRDHFTIASTDEGLFLTDRKSKLRTYINRKMIESDQRESIAPEDIISIPAPTGEVKFRLCYVGEENFAPDKPGESHTKIILILAAVIIILIIVFIWLLGD